MASLFFALPTTTLKQAFATLIHLHCSNNVLASLITAKSLKTLSIANFINLKFTYILPASRPASQPASQNPVVLGAWFQNFYTAKIIMLDL